MEISRYASKIRVLQSEIGEIERGEVKHYCQDDKGRLKVDDTARILRAARVSLALQKRLALLPL